MQLLVIISVDEYGQTINDAKVSTLKASVGLLNSTIDEQRKLLVEVEDICGRDGHGGQNEDGKSSLIDRIRAHLRKLDLSRVNKKTKEVYRIGAPYSASAEIVVYGDPEIASYAWRIETLGKVTKDSERKAYGCAEIALRDALIASSD